VNSTREKKSDLRLRWKLWLERDTDGAKPTGRGEEGLRKSEQMGRTIERKRSASGLDNEPERPTRRTRERKKPAFGQGVYVLLKSIQETGTITRGAESLGMSYRYAWNLIREIERGFGIKLLETRRGGSNEAHGVGGGGATVTEEGLRLMRIYHDAIDAFDRVAANVKMRS
jgi:molybdate transport system regulatory protein